VGGAEELEVQKIALCYWRKMMAIRYEHEAIRQRTGDMRGREEHSRENDFDLFAAIADAEVPEALPPRALWPTGPARG
jgi:hypothetical protein